MTDVWLSDAEQAAWRSWLRAYVLIDAQLNRHLQREADLSQADYAVLVHLSESPKGRLRGFELAQGMQWEKSRLSHHLTRMERRGLIERQGCPTDGRGAFVALTAEGRDRIVDVAPRHVAEVRKWFVEPLTPEQLVALGEASAILVAALEGGGGGCPGVEVACDEASACDAVADASPAD